jgi:hypothetical protein
LFDCEFKIPTSSSRFKRHAFAIAQSVVVLFSSGNKVAFWILRNTEFDASRFSRRQKEEVLGMSVWVTAPEDTILSKLDWAKQSGGSEKQLTDARGVYEVQFYNLSTSYLSAWVERLTVQDLWQRLISEAKIE